MMSKTFCTLPWIHLATHPYGGVTLCCVSDMIDAKNTSRNYGDGYIEYLNLNKNSLSEIMNSDYYKEVRKQFLNGEVPEACNRCFQEESNGIRSKRIEENENYSHFTYDDATKITKEDGTIPTDLKFIELRLGNLCNVKCRSCNPASSTKWVKEYDKVEKEFDFVQSYQDVKGNEHYNWPDRDEFWEDLFEHSKKVEWIYINGGEPTLMKKHWEYLDKLVESGLSKDISLWYSINMTNIPPKTFEVWNHFKNIRVSCSIDDLDKRNFYLRYPTKWDSVLNNIKLLMDNKNLDVSVCQTISFLNVFYIDEFYDFFTNKLGLHIHQNYVYDPNFLSPWILPTIIKKNILKKCKGVMNTLDYSLLSNTLLNNSSDEKLLSQGIQYNKFLDGIRNEKVTDTFSELFEKLNA
jgi:organic radical activating enzyme